MWLVARAGTARNDDFPASEEARINGDRSRAKKKNSCGDKDNGHGSPLGGGNCHSRCIEADHCRCQRGDKSAQQQGAADDGEGTEKWRTLGEAAPTEKYRSSTENASQQQQPQTRAAARKCRKQPQPDLLFKNRDCREKANHAGL